MSGGYLPAASDMEGDVGVLWPGRGCPDRGVRSHSDDFRVSNPPSSAAQVGDVAISEAAIFDRSAAMVQAQQTTDATVSPVGVAEVNRRQTTAAIRGHLLVLAADEAGVQVSDSDVNAALSGAGSAATAAEQLGVPNPWSPKRSGICCGWRAC
jgi:hypothetical protein